MVVSSMCLPSDWGFSSSKPFSVAGSKPVSGHCPSHLFHGTGTGGLSQSISGPAMDCPLIGLPLAIWTTIQSRHSATVFSMWCSFRQVGAYPKISCYKLVQFRKRVEFRIPETLRLFLLFAGHARSSRVMFSENKIRTTAWSLRVYHRVVFYRNKSWNIRHGKPCTCGHHLQEAVK